MASMLVKNYTVEYKLIGNSSDLEGALGNVAKSAKDVADFAIQMKNALKMNASETSAFGKIAQVYRDIQEAANGLKIPNFGAQFQEQLNGMVAATKVAVDDINAAFSKLNTGAETMARLQKILNAGSKGKNPLLQTRSGHFQSYFNRAGLNVKSIAKDAKEYRDITKSLDSLKKAEIEALNNFNTYSDKVDKQQAGGASDSILAQMDKELDKLDEVYNKAEQAHKQAVQRLSDLRKAYGNKTPEQFLSPLLKDEKLRYYGSEEMFPSITKQAQAMASNSGSLTSALHMAKAWSDIAESTSALNLSVNTADAEGAIRAFLTRYSELVNGLSTKPIPLNVAGAKTDKKTGKVSLSLAVEPTITQKALNAAVEGKKLSNVPIVPKLTQEAFKAATKDQVFEVFVKPTLMEGTGTAFLNQLNANKEDAIKGLAGPTAKTKYSKDGLSVLNGRGRDYWEDSLTAYQNNIADLEKLLPKTKSGAISKRLTKEQSGILQSISNIKERSIPYVQAVLKNWDEFGAEGVAKALNASEQIGENKDWYKALNGRVYTQPEVERLTSKSKKGTKSGIDVPVNFTSNFSTLAEQIKTFKPEPIGVEVKLLRDLGEPMNSMLRNLQTIANEHPIQIKSEFVPVQQPAKQTTGKVATKQIPAKLDITKAAIDAQLRAIKPSTKLIPAKLDISKKSIDTQLNGIVPSVKTIQGKIDVSKKSIDAQLKAIKPETKLIPVKLDLTSKAIKTQLDKFNAPAISVPVKLLNNKTDLQKQAGKLSKPNIFANVKLKTTPKELNNQIKAFKAPDFPVKIKLGWGTGKQSMASQTKAMNDALKPLDMKVNLDIKQALEQLKVLKESAAAMNPIQMTANVTGKTEKAKASKAETAAMAAAVTPKTRISSRRMAESVAQGNMAAMAAAGLRASRPSSVSASTAQRLGLADRFRRFSQPFMSDSKFGVGTPAAVSMAKGMGMMYAISGAMEIVSGAFNQVSEYQHAMQTVKSILETTDNDGDFNGRFANMQNTIRKVGRETKFTAPEVAGAAKFMAMAGLNISDINAATKPVANLALVGDNDLTETADKMTNIMTAFGLLKGKSSADKKVSMEHASDVLTNTFTRSNTDLLQLANAMEYAGPMSHLTGTSLEDAAAMVGVMGNAGIQASMAGTNLRMIYQNLISPNKKQTAEWARLGIKRTDENGLIRPIFDILTDLRNKITGSKDINSEMSENQRKAMAKEMSALFRVTAGSGAASIIENLGQVISLANSNRSANGVAAKIAEDKKNTIQGLWAQVTSTFTDQSVNTVSEFQQKIKQMLMDIRDWLASPEAAQTLGNIYNMAKEILGILGDVTKAWNWIIQHFGGVFTSFIKFQFIMTQIGYFMKAGVQVLNVIQPLTNGFFGLARSMSAVSAATGFGAASGAAGAMGRRASFATAATVAASAAGKGRILNPYYVANPKKYSGGLLPSALAAAGLTGLVPGSGRKLNAFMVRSPYYKELGYAWSPIAPNRIAPYPHPPVNGVQEFKRWGIWTKSRPYKIDSKMGWLGAMSNHMRGQYAIQHEKLYGDSVVLPGWLGIGATPAYSHGRTAQWHTRYVTDPAYIMPYHFGGGVTHGKPINPNETKEIFSRLTTGKDKKFAGFASQQIDALRYHGLQSQKYASIAQTATDASLIALATKRSNEHLSAATKISKALEIQKAAAKAQSLAALREARRPRQLANVWLMSRAANMGIPIATQWRQGLLDARNLRRTQNLANAAFVSRAASMGMLNRANMWRGMGTMVNAGLMAGTFGSFFTNIRCSFQSLMMSMSKGIGMLASPVGLVTAGLVGLGTAIYLAYSRAKEAQETMEGLSKAMAQQRIENAKIYNSYYAKVSELTGTPTVQIGYDKEKDLAGQSYSLQGNSAAEYFKNAAENSAIAGSSIYSQIENKRLLPKNLVNEYNHLIDPKESGLGFRTRSSSDIIDLNRKRELAARMGVISSWQNVAIHDQAIQNATIALAEAQQNGDQSKIRDIVEAFTPKKNAPKMSSLEGAEKIFNLTDPQRYYEYQEAQHRVIQELIDSQKPLDDFKNAMTELTKLELMKDPSKSSQVALVRKFLLGTTFTGQNSISGSVLFNKSGQIDWEAMKKKYNNDVAYTTAQKIDIVQKIQESMQQNEKLQKSPAIFDLLKTYLPQIANMRPYALPGDDVHVGDQIVWEKWEGTIHDWFLNSGQYTGHKTWAQYWKDKDFKDKDAMNIFTKWARQQAAKNKGGGKLSDVGNPTSSSSDQSKYGNKYGQNTLRPTQIIFNITDLCKFDNVRISSNSKDAAVADLRGKVAMGVNEIFQQAVSELGIMGESGGMA